MTTPTLQVQFDPSIARFGASKSQKRLEDDRLLVGKGLYSDDRVLPRQAWLVILRSPHAHAEIKGIDLAEARTAPGVIAAWSMAEQRADKVGPIPFPAMFKRADGAPMSAPPRTPLAEGRVYYVGQPVAAIVAETRQQAQDAADLVAPEYEDLPCVVDARAAIEAGAPQIWPQAPGNVAAETRYGDAAATAAAFAQAAHVVEVELHNHRLNAMALEPRCAIGVHEGGRTTLYTQNQTPTGTRYTEVVTFATMASGMMAEEPTGTAPMLPSSSMRSARIRPSRSRASAPLKCWSRPMCAARNSSERSARHFTGRPSLRAA